ncbi:hypothetical protein, partial [Aeromonas veronii]|uniref:hypothetical protein n=1 Tax=Aeromonas veronii TaxID=654 RepID=UPI00406D3033
DNEELFKQVTQSLNTGITIDEKVKAVEVTQENLLLFKEGEEKRRQRAKKEKIKKDQEKLSKPLPPFPTAEQVIARVQRPERNL